MADWRNVLLAVLVLAGIGGAWHHWSTRPVQIVTPGQLAPDEPEQRPVDGAAQASRWGEFQVTP
ncbi:MAG TPA: hypothetical protein VHE37_09295, partial [Nevskiaceae bacterium]|nr:hypothetical protein [Nevskiaceae bacterium]